MATAKKVASKATKTTKKVTAPPKTAKPVVKIATKVAPASKTVKAIAGISAKIAKLTERRTLIVAQIASLKEQRLTLRSAAAPVASVAPKTAAKSKATPAKKAKAAAAK